MHVVKCEKRRQALTDSSRIIVWPLHKFTLGSRGSVIWEIESDSIGLNLQCIVLMGDRNEQNIISMSQVLMNTEEWSAQNNKTPINLLSFIWMGYIHHFLVL